MGGLLFKTERLKAKDYYFFEKYISKKLEKENIYFKIPRYFSNKEDFGDMDVLVSSREFIATVSFVKRILKPTLFDEIKWLFFKGKRAPLMQDSFSNGPVFSIKIMDFQIDFIQTKLENLNIAYHYFSWNDLGNLMGRLTRKFNLKYGQEGLVYILKIEDQVVADIPVSKDINKILSFMGLNSVKFNEGFKTRQEIFEFVHQSTYFNPYVYDLQNTNKINRDRDKKRTTHKEWLEYIEPLKSLYPSYEEWRTTYPKEEALKQIKEFFPEAQLDYEILKYTVAYKKNKERADKFNGKMVMEVTGLEGKIIGSIIADFKNHIFNTNDRGGFNKFLDTSNANEVKEIFTSWFKNYIVKKANNIELKETNNSEEE